MARRTRQISLKECYEILNLQKGADLQAVKSAYRRRAFELHPDLNPDDPEASFSFWNCREASGSSGFKSGCSSKARRR